MKTLNDILYPITNIWESDVWGKDVIFESKIPEPEIEKIDYKEFNITAHVHTYQYKVGEHTGEVIIRHHSLTDPKKPHEEDEDSEEYPGSADISIKDNKTGYSNVDKKSIPPKTRAAITIKVKSIIDHHIRHHFKPFAEQMKRVGIPAYLRAEAYEPNAQNSPSAYKAARQKHIAYGNMLNSLSKKHSDILHPWKKPEETGYEDIIGSFPAHIVHAKI